MAVVKLLPRKAAPAQGREQSMEERLAYDANPDKTRDGRLVSSYMCQPETAAAEFEAAKVIYEATTGRSQPKGRDVTMYRVMQSFKPREVTPEEANKIGYELAMEFTRGQHQFVVYTHEDKAHIHNHIEINSTNLDCDGKFKNVWDSVDVLSRINDRICLSHGLSIPEPKKERALTEGEKGAARNGRSFKERLRHAIDILLPGCGSFEEFLSRMREEGYEVKYRGKSLEFRAHGQERFTRSFRLGEEYTEQQLRERIMGNKARAAAVQDTQSVADRHEAAGQDAKNKADWHGDKGRNTQSASDHYGDAGQYTSGRHGGTGQYTQNTSDRHDGTGKRKRAAGSNRTGHTAGGKRQDADSKVNLMVDIQAKLRAGKGKGYEQWAKAFNLKEASRTVNFLTEKGVSDYGELESRTEAAGQKFDSLSAHIRQLEGRMAEKAQMKMHIINYAKTRDIYAAYKKTGCSGKFREMHREEIEKHEAAKAAFDSLGGRQIPKVSELSGEYTAILAEKQACYEEYREARKEMIEFQTAKRNVDKILGITPYGQEQKKQQEMQH